MRLYHNYLFLFGFIYYLVCPIIVQYFHILEDAPAMNLFYQNSLSEEELKRYVLMCFLLFVAFYAGSFGALMFRKKCIVLNDIPISSISTNYPKVKMWLLFPLLLINQYLIFSHRSILFTGYTLDYPVGFLGNIATFNSLYLFLFLYAIVISDCKRNFLKFLLIENSVVLIGLGSRMFVLIPVVAFLIYLLDQKKIKSSRLVAVAGVCIFFFLLVGVFRGGEGAFNSDVFLFIGLGEPLLTWLTVSTFITNNPTIGLLEYPGNFLGTFINFIPSFIFPSKADFIPSIPYVYDSPFGATSIFTSLYGNFGLLVAPLFVFLGGFLLTVIRYRVNIFFQIYYYCCCGIIPFLLFRDMQSANKLLFTGFLLFPAIAIYISWVKGKIHA